jgi:hypothetical protein
MLPSPSGHAASTPPSTAAAAPAVVRMPVHARSSTTYACAYQAKLGTIAASDPSGSKGALPLFSDVAAYVPIFGPFWIAAVLFLLSGGVPEVLKRLSPDGHKWLMARGYLRDLALAALMIATLIGGFQAWRTEHKALGVMQVALASSQNRLAALSVKPAARTSTPAPVRQHSAGSTAILETVAPPANNAYKSRLDAFITRANQIDRLLPGRDRSREDALQYQRLVIGWQAAVTNYLRETKGDDLAAEFAATSPLEAPNVVGGVLNMRQGPPTAVDRFDAQRAFLQGLLDG